MTRLELYKSLFRGRLEKPGPLTILCRNDMVSLNRSEVVRLSVFSNTRATRNHEIAANVYQEHLIDLIEK
ncbi:MAG: hypothetical protein V2B15_14505 [Bacteroidota bacterium]